MSQEAYDKAMEELDELEKSQKAGDETQDELDQLTKSLEEELGEDLSKSSDDDSDDDSDDEGSEPDEKEFEKSQNEDFDDELVKASEAYASLEKSVQEGIGGVFEELDVLKKSLAANMNLNIKMAKVMAGMAHAMPEIESITKSVRSLAAQPTSPSKAVLGMKDAEEIAPLTKSVGEITELLTKAVSAGKIDSRHLSVFGSYRDVNRLPEEVKTIIGL